MLAALLARGGVDADDGVVVDGRLWKGNPVLYFHEFRDNCQLVVHEITPVSCDTVLEEDRGDHIYVPRAIRADVDVDVGSQVAPATPVLASPAADIHNTHAACVYYGPEPVYVYVELQELLGAAGTVVVGISGTVPEGWCTPLS